MNHKSIIFALIFLPIIVSLMIHVDAVTVMKVAKETGQDDKMAGMENEENTNVPNGFAPANPHPNASQPTNATIQNLTYAHLKQEGSPVLGKASSPITIIEFGDLQCRFCGRFARDTEPQINQTYIQTGKVNLVFKHFVTHGPDSMTAAIASQCANEQGRFWKFYELLYANQGEENSGWASAGNLKKFASQIPEMDITKFNSCLDNQKYKPIVDNDTAFAYKSGFQGTPTLIVEKSNGSDLQVLLGAYPFPVLQAILDKKISGG
jgi:protein-disulfide isomerase